MDYRTLVLGCNFRLFNDTTQRREVQKESTPSGKLVFHLKNNRFSDTYSIPPSQIHQAPTSHSLPNRKQTPNKASGLVINPNHTSPAPTPDTRALFDYVLCMVYVRDRGVRILSAWLCMGT